MLSVPHAPRLDDRNIPRKKSTFTSRRVAPSRSFSRTQPARVLKPLDPLGGPFAFFVFCLCLFFWEVERSRKRTYGSFLSVQISPLPFGKGWKKFKKKVKKRKCKDGTEREREQNQIVIVTFQILEEDVSVSRTSSRSQIADRRSARVHPLTKKLSE